MKSEIPNFDEDWTELKKDGQVSFLDDKLFAELRSYVKYEPPDKFFAGTSILFYGEEVIKIWTIAIIPGVGAQEVMALCLEDGEWVISLPVNKGQDSSKIFTLDGSPDSPFIKISVLTASGWKIRTIKTE